MSHARAVGRDGVVSAAVGKARLVIEAEAGAVPRRRLSPADGVDVVEVVA